MEDLGTESTSLKQYIQSLLDSNSDRISLSSIRRLRMTSESVKFYQRISLDNKSTDFVSCVLCKRVVTYIVENGVKTLNWHLINCINSDNFDESLYNSLISDKNTDSIDFNNSPENKTINSQVLRDNGLDESISDEKKLLIEDLSQENFQIKQIVKICLKLINSCDCFDKHIINERKVINSMISDYNKYLNNKQNEKLGKISKNLTNNCNNSINKEKNSCEVLIDNEFDGENSSKHKLIDDLIQENCKIKKIVKKCLESTNFCKCFDKDINNDRKRVNSMISDYNKYINSKRIEKFGNSGNKSNGLVNDNEEHKELVKSEPQVNGNEGLVEPVNSEVCDNEEHEESVISEPEVIDIEENEELADSEPEINSQKNRDLRTDEKSIKKVKEKISVSDYYLSKTNGSKESKLRSIALKKKYSILKQKHLATNFNQKYVCDWIGCGKVFRIGFGLRNHRKIHTEVHNYVCYWPGCEQEFSKQSLLNCHIRKHKSLKPFKCDECGYGTDHKSKLKSHQKVHSGVKLLGCDWPGCGFKTNYANTLKLHKRIHTNERPYRCQWPECEWAFKSSDTLKVHMLKHTGERPVECAEAGCGQRFTTRQVMRFHYERKHKHS